MSDRIVESLNEMKQIYLESVSGNVISNRDEYLEFVEEKYKKSKKEDEEEDKEEKEEDEEEKEEEDEDEDEEDKPKRWWDDDGDGKGWEKGEVSGNFKKKVKKVDESFSDWRHDLYEAIGDIEDEIEGSKQRQIKERSNIHNKIDINPNVNIGESVELSEEYIEEVIDVAAQYLYDQGLNEEGLQMVIEDLGVDKFLEYVFYISEDLLLTEARTLTGKKTTPATGQARGISLKAAPGKTTKAAVEAGKRIKKLPTASNTIRKRLIKSDGDGAVKTATSNQEPRGFNRAAGKVKDFVTSPETKETLRSALSDVVKRGKRDLARTVLSGVEAGKAAKKAKERGATGAGALGAAAGTFFRGITRGVGRGGVREEIEAFLQEKAESEQQQKLFGLALSVKRGETPRSEVSQQVLDIVDEMSEAQIRKYAKTKHEGLPKKKED